MTRFQKWLVLALALWGVPAWFFWLAVGVGGTIMQDRQTERVRESLQRALDEFSGNCLADAFLQRFSDSLSADLGKTPIASPAFQETLRKARSVFPQQALSLMLFDARGSCFQADLPNDRAQIDEFFSCLRKPLEPDFEKIPAVLGGRTFLGLPFFVAHDALRLRGPGVVVNLKTDVWTVEAPDSCFFVSYPSPLPDRLGGMVALFFRDRLSPLFFHRQALSGLSAGPARVGFWFDAERFQAPDGLTAGEFRELVALFRSRPASRFSAQGKLVEGRFSADSAVVLAFADQPVASPLPYLLCLLLYVPVSVRMLVVLYRSALLDHPLPLSLGNKLVFLFALALVFPFGIASGIAGLYLQEKREEQRTESRQSAFRLLGGIDTEFDRFLQQQELLYRGWCRDFQAGRSSLDELIGRLKRQQEAALIDDVMLTRVDGAPVSIIRSPLYANSRRLLALPLEERRRVMKELFQAGWGEDFRALQEMYSDDGSGRITPVRYKTEGDDLLRKAMKVMATEMIGGSRPSAKQEISLSGFLTDDLRSMLEAIKANLGKIFRRNGIREDNYHFAEIVQPPDGKDPMFLLLSISGDSLQQEFLQRFFADRDGPPWRDRIRAIGFPGALPRSYPEVGDAVPFRPILNAIAGRGQDNVAVEVDLQGARWEACLQKGRRLRKYSLVHLTPLEEFASGDRSRRLAAVVFLTGSLAMGIFIGWLFRRKLLVPLYAVDAGISAIRGKRYEHRIPVLSNDELGQLCREFNLAIGHLREMEAAKIIQTSLYPSEECLVGGFRISGRNQMTQAIGGDYFDVIPLPDGRQAFVLGDVSGHGVSAALVTAMAKAGFTILLPLMADDPGQLLTRLSEAFLAILNKKKMMTCVLGILDPATGKTTIFNAGQCSPFLISASDGGNPGAFLELPSSPLGLLKKFRTASIEIDLTGRVLVLYSDGLIEATNLAGDQVGYDAFSAIVSGLVRPDRHLALDEILAGVRTRTDPVPWDDDATLVVIQPREIIHSQTTRDRVQ